MSFLEPVFFPFAIVALIAYYAAIKLKLNQRIRVFILFIGSCLFYIYSSVWYYLLLLGISTVSYATGELANYTRGKKRFLIWLSGIVLTIAPLFFFKYYGFLAENLGFTGEKYMVGMMLPLGISFYTFQNISYISGRIHKEVPLAERPINYLTYITFFPQLVAGPIVTADQFLPQIRKKLGMEKIRITEGAFFLISGYLKKAVLADHLAQIVDPVFARPEMFGWLALVTSTIAYSMQIYFDFSGYSDIALGLGSLFGFTLPENFNFPYLSGGLREFWRRWHITLSRWLKNHIFIPLGGSRRGNGILIGSIMVTMVLGGLWHGAHWNFVIWGFLHGLLLLMERAIPGKMRTENWRRFLGIPLTFTMVTLLWVLFRCGSMAQGTAKALEIYAGIFSLKTGVFSENDLRFTLFCLLGMMTSPLFYDKLKERFFGANPLLRGATVAVLALGIISLAAEGESFIYFIF